MPPSAIGAVMYFVLKHDRTKAMEFYNAVLTGENLRRGDPRLSLRNFFINRPAGQRPNARVQLALLIKTWNAWVEGRELLTLKFMDNEEFPVLLHMQRVRATRRVTRGSETRVSA